MLTIFQIALLWLKEAHWMHKNQAKVILSIPKYAMCATRLSYESKNQRIMITNLHDSAPFAI